MCTKGAARESRYEIQTTVPWTASLECTQKASTRLIFDSTAELPIIALTDMVMTQGTGPELFKIDVGGRADKLDELLGEPGL